MKVLLLSPYPEDVGDTVEKNGDTWVSTDCIVDEEYCRSQAVDWIVSYGYRHIVGKQLIDAYADRIVNLHLSYLPWNRGADPNLWSWIDGTPKGVTLHHIDEGIDTGDIVDQMEVSFSQSETLATSYVALRKAVVLLFERAWPKLRSGTAGRQAQSEKGSSHKSRDKAPFIDHLPAGWETPTRLVPDIVRKYLSTS